MFTNNSNTTAGGGGYTNVKPGGTAFLRNAIKTSMFNGDPYILDRLVTAQLHWKFYNNRHWAANNDTLLSFNYVRAVIDKVNNFIVGKEGFTIQVVDDYGDEILPEVEKTYESLLNYNWRKNQKLIAIKKILQMGSITGDAYVFISPNMRRGYVEYTLLDSRTTVPMFEKGNYNEIIGYKVYKLLGTNDQKYICKVTEYTANKVTTYYTKDTGDRADRYEVNEQSNAFDWIPVVHIENIPMSEAYGGKSDVEDVVKLNKTYNEQAENIKSIIDYYAAPTTVITGGTVGQLVRGVNQIWSGLPSDAEVFNLNMDADLSSSNQFLQLLKASIHDLSGVPEEVLSKVQHISNTSAAALQVLYQPMIQVADSKVVSYGTGLEQLHEMTMLMYHTYFRNHPLYEKFLQARLSSPESPEDFFGRYKAEPVFKYNLPNDRLAQLNEAQIEVTIGVASKREIMERLGKKNIPLIESQIKKDQQDQLDFDVKLKEAGVSSPTQGPDPKPGPQAGDAKPAERPTV